VVGCSARQSAWDTTSDDSPMRSLWRGYKTSWRQHNKSFSMSNDLGTGMGV
jgi:hypothetical protein